MDLEFSDDQSELRRSVSSFLAKECPPAVVRAVVESGASPAPLWAAMTALDWPALAVPEDCGGLGLGFVEVAVLVEELGAAIAPGPYLPTVTQFAAAVAEAGTPAQRVRFLTPVAAGQVTGALAVADHSNHWGADQRGPGRAATQARASGDGYELRGTKHLVMAGPEVDQLVVTARLGGPGPAGEPGDPTGLFVVDAAEVAFQPVRALDASRPLSTVTLDSVVVPADRRLGHHDADATGALARVLEQAAVALALEVVGTCQTLFDLTVAYAKDRQQFGVPIGSFQAVKHKLADGFVALQRARALAYYAVAAIAEDSPSRPLAAAMAKAAADDCQRKVGQEAIQILGGIGFTWEHDAHLYVKRARSSAVLFGGGAEHRRTIARLLGVGAAP